jgi:hypothetical protein
MKLIILLLLTLSATLNGNTSNKKIMHRKHHLHTMSSQEVDFYATNAESYAPFARLAYCNKVEVSDLTCSFCDTFANEYATFFIHSVVKEPHRIFQFVIVYSDTKREIVISFSGPKSDEGGYFNSIFDSGMVAIPELGGIKIEREYWEIYSISIRDLLAEKIQKISESGRADYTFIFIGHSIGGSFATLASYDMVTNNIVIKTEESPLVYTYGQLRIGDDEFVNKVNDLVKVIKILRKDDYIARRPNCSFKNGVYKCRSKKFSKKKHTHKGKYFKKLPKKLAILPHQTKVFAKRTPPRFKEKDPIVRGTTFIGGQLVHTHIPMFYSQPLGTELFYNGPNFSDYQLCNYVNGIPVCEKDIAIPSTFSPDVHRIYYNTNLELC